MFSLRSSEWIQNFEQVQSSWHPSPFRKFVAHSGSLYYVEEVCTHFEPVLKNVVRTSLGGDRAFWRTEMVVGWLFELSP